MTTPLIDQVLTGQTLSVPINDNAEAARPAFLYGRRRPACVGLTWGYYGGVTPVGVLGHGTVTLSASATNYIEVDTTTYVPSVNTTGFTTGRIPIRKVVTDTAGATSDDSMIVFQLGAGTTTSGIAGNTVNVFTKNQSVVAVSLTDGATIAVDASLSNQFRVTLAGNRTLANPSALTSGMILNIKIKQDSTGSRTLGYGSKFKWPGGTAPVLSTTPNAIDLLSCVYDSADDVLLCNLLKGFA